MIVDSQAEHLACTWADQGSLHPSQEKGCHFGEGGARERKKLFLPLSSFSNKGDKARVTSKRDIAT